MGDLKQTDYAVDFHCHGVGKYDFTEINGLDLDDIEEHLAEQRQKSVLTLYLPKQNFNDFLKLMHKFSNGKKHNKYSHIVGIGLEGPLLASHGGTPESGVWLPNESEWEKIASCGSDGLLYIVFSPDATVEGSNFYGAPIDIVKICKILLRNGVLPSPGHFVKTNPLESARLLQLVYNTVAEYGFGPTVTDHLYNDMPRNFKHSWRTLYEKRFRQTELDELNIDKWNLSNLEEKLGPVPAVMIKNARAGVVKLCQNFDGEHVDLAIVKKTIELAGEQNLLMMTDSIESKRLAGRKLTQQDGSGLLYQDAGVVAAGSQNIERQLMNMYSIGMTDLQIKLITKITPQNVLDSLQSYHASGCREEV